VRHDVTEGIERCSDRMAEVSRAFDLPSSAKCAMSECVQMHATSEGVPYSI